MDLLANHFNALTFLFAGALFVIAGVYAYIKGEALAGMVCLIYGATFTAQGFLDLTKLTIPGWVHPLITAVLGIGMILTCISKLYTSSSPSSRRQNWWFLAFGVGMMLLAIFQARNYYWP